MRLLLALFAALATVVLTGCPGPSSSPSSSSATPAPTPSGPPPSYQGVWTTKDDKDEPFDIVVYANGQAVTTWTRGVAGARGERGLWRIDGQRLVVLYDDGWTDVISPDGAGFKHSGYSPETLLNQTPTNTAPASRVDGPTAQYTGIWRLNKEPNGNYLYITLSSDGQAVSTVNSLTEGKWAIENNTAVCRWPDGWVDVIEPAGKGFQKRSGVGAPSDATPADIAPATRVGELRFTITP